MASLGPSQNATVEEILASIRQAISEDDARRTLEMHRADPRSLAERRPVASVSRILAPTEPDETEVNAAVEPAAAVVQPSFEQGAIELAIEQALDGVRAELEGGKAPVARLRPRTADGAAAAAQRTIPRAAVRGTALRREMPSPRRALLSPRADAQVSASFDDLAKAMIEGNTHKLDEVVENLLRPMLKTWLESNLPQMVERLVREEIERVSRGHR